MTIVCDPLVRSDAARCAELENVLFDGDDPWPEAAFVRELAVAHNRYVGARVDDLLVGYAGIARLGRTPPFEFEIHTIGVDPEFQGQGIGRSLLAGVLDHYPLETFHHQVLIAERDADGFYRRMGMSAVGSFGLTAFIRTQKV